jgi:hypothetical protein
VLRAHDAGTATCDSERWRLEAVLDRIDAAIAELRQTRHLVTTTMADCQAGQCRLASPGGERGSASAIAGHHLDTRG